MTFRSNNLFVERTEINEFLRDGSLLNEIYDELVDIFFMKRRGKDSDKSALRVLNSAYKICWLITESGVDSYDDLIREMYFRKNDLLIRDLSYILAWCILKVYGEFYDFDNNVIEDIRRSISNKAYFSQFRELVRLQNDPSCPISFRCPGLPMNEDDDQDEEVGKTPDSDRIDDHLNSIKFMTDRLLSDNRKLANELEESESAHKKEIETLEVTIERQRAQIRSLNQQLKEKETKVVTREVTKEVIKEVVKEHPLLKILNWDTITNYGLGLGNYKDVQVILNMLNRISTRNHYFDDNLDANIVKLEQYLRELQKPAAPHVEGDYVIEKNVREETHANANCNRNT